jgi:FtsZ-interacting cell division protein ZipA
MPKKLRKIRIGSTAWAKQKERDKLFNAAKGKSSQPEKKYKTDFHDESEERAEDKRRRTRANEERKRKKQEQSQEQEQEQSQEQESRSPTSLALLGLTRLATIPDIKRAYHRLALMYHPDKNSNPTAAERMKKINTAYEDLINK